MIGEVIRQHFDVELGLEGAGLKQSFDFGSEIKRAVIKMSEVERLHTEAIARDEKLFLASVPDCEREHTTQVIDASCTVVFVKMENRFCIAVCAINVTAR